MRVTIKGFFYDQSPSGVSLVETQARTDFKAARGYAISLIEIHDTITKGKAGRPPTQYEALKRSALILAVTAWESFVEDTVQQQLELRLAATSSPAQMISTFNTVAHEWLLPDGPKRHPPSLIDWTGDSWKRIIRDSLKAKLEKFNTPNTANVDSLIDRYLQHVSISHKWSWQGVSSAKASKQLDALIKLRGRAVHRGKRMHPKSQPEPEMKRQTVENALNLIYNLVAATEKALGIEPRPLPVQPATP